MNRYIHSAKKYAATAPVGRFAAGAVLLLAAAGTVGATQGMEPFAAHHGATVASAVTDDPWTVAPRTDDPWTSAPATTDGARTDDPWT
ncbi:hypothetical protein ACQB60_06050 [Actinomycetota bacterium Odt1-20B]